MEAEGCFLCTYKEPLCVPSLIEPGSFLFPNTESMLYPEVLLKEETVEEEEAEIAREIKLLVVVFALYVTGESILLNERKANLIQYLIRDYVLRGGHRYTKNEEWRHE